MTIRRPRKRKGADGWYSFPYLTEKDFAKIAKTLRDSKTAMEDKEVRSALQEAIRTYASDKALMNQSSRPAEMKAALQRVHQQAGALIETLTSLDDSCLALLNQSLDFPLTLPSQSARLFSGLIDSKDRNNEMLSEIDLAVPLPGAREQTEPDSDQRPAHLAEPGGAEPMYRSVGDLYGLASDHSVIHRLFSASERALATVEKLVERGTKGRPKHKASLRVFIKELARIFEQVTGKRATVSWDWLDDEYGGMFLNFARACLEMVDKDEAQNDSALAQQIKQALKPNP